jgi:hypothetical protein
MIVIKTPFDILNLLGKKSYEDIPTVDKKRHSFIINRMMSRALPDIAFNMSNQYIQAETIVDFWHNVYLELDKTPRGKTTLGYIRKCMFISMSTAKKKTPANIDKDLSKQYMIISGLGQKEFDVLATYYESELIKYLKKFSKMIETTK